MGASRSATGLGSPEGPEPDKPSPPNGAIPSAGSLTPSQRAAIAAAREMYAGSFVLPEFGPYKFVTNQALARKGLAEPFFDSRRTFQLSAAGLKVREGLGASAIEAEWARCEAARCRRHESAVPKADAQNISHPDPLKER
jgi:hypothetical protein